MITVRCSHLPRLAVCAASGRPPEVPTEPARGPSDLGTAFHRCMELIASGRAYDVDEEAAGHNVDPDELGRLVGWADRTWRETLSPMFPDPAVERPLSFHGATVTLTGKPDLVSVADRELRVGDWKTGWLDADAFEQLRGYAFLAYEARRAEVDSIRLVKIDARRRRADVHVWAPQRLADWWGWLCGHLAGGGAERPGPHCGRCPRALECAGHAQQVRWVAAALRGDLAETLGEVPDPATLPYTLQLVRLVARRCDDFTKALKAHVEAHGGRLGDLVVTERVEKSIDVDRGYDVLADSLTPAVLMPLLKVGKGDVEDAVKAAAPRGFKGLAVKELFERLDAGGALNRTTRTTLEVLNDGGDRDETGPEPVGPAAGGDGPG